MIKDKSKKLLSVEGIFIILLFILFCYLFVENFVFSESYEIALFRSWDDCVFNESLNNWQKNFFEVNIFKILCFNDFAYGWIFWALHGIVTYPFYLLGLEQITISTTRNLSLIMSFASLYFIYRIMGYYSNNKYYKMLVILSIISSYSFIRFSLSFDTTAMITFFGILSVYFIIKDKDLNYKTILLSSVCLGISVATKIIGCVFISVAFLLLLDRLKNNELKIKFKKICTFLLIFIFSAIFFTNPGIIIFRNAQTTNQIVGYFNYLISGTTFSPHKDFRQCFQEFSDFFGTNVTILFLLLYFFKIIRNLKQKQYDYLYYFICLITLPVLFFFLDVSQSCLDIPKYYSVIIILLPFSLIELENLKKLGYYIGIIIFILFLWHLDTYDTYFRQEKIVRSNNFYIILEDLKEVIKPNKDGIISYLTSHNGIIIPYASIGDNIKRELMDIDIKEYENYDYLIFFLNPPSFCIDDNEKGNYNNQMKDIIEKIDNNNLIFNTTYKKIYDKYDTVVYKKDGI